MVPRRRWCIFDIVVGPYAGWGGLNEFLSAQVSMPTLEASVGTIGVPCHCRFNEPYECALEILSILSIIDWDQEATVRCLYVLSVGSVPGPP